MKTLRKIALIATMLYAIGFGKAYAQETSANLSNTFISKNMFYGMNFESKPMSQLYAEVNKSDITGSIWTNYDINNTRLVETDFKIKKNQSTEVGDATFTFNPAVAYYAFPNSTMGDAIEVMVEGGITGTAVDLSYKAGKVFGKDSGEGAMGIVGASKDVKLTENISVSGRIEAIYLDNYFCNQKGISSIAGTVGMTWTPTPKFNINASVTTQKRTNESFKDIVYNESWGTMTVNYNLAP